MSHTHFKNQLYDYFKTQKNCDVWFKLKKNDLSQTRIGAHKLVLALASDMFEIMFFGEGAKLSLFYKGSVVTIPDIKPHIFYMFLRFVYGEEDVKFEKPEDVIDFYHFSHKYNCKDAKNFSKVHMERIVTSQNATAFYEVAVLYDITDLKETCLQIFSQNTSDLLKSSEFLVAQVSTVEAIFALKKAAIDSEMDYVTALEKYIAHHKAKDRDIEKKVRPALQSIRFLTLTSTQIAQTSFLTAEEIRQLLICLTEDADLALMPSSFSMSQEKRNVSKTLDSRNGHRSDSQRQNKLDQMFNQLSVD